MLFIVDGSLSLDAEGHATLVTPIGPFRSAEEAREWMRSNLPSVHGSWNVGPLYAPSEVEH